MTPEEFKEVARAVVLTLDNPASVRRQGSRLVAARNKLKEYHQKIVAIQKSKKQAPFTVAELEDDSRLFERLMAIQEGSEEILDDVTWLRLIVESLAIDCNRLIVKAKKYLNPEGGAAKPQPSQPTRSQTRSQSPTPPRPTEPTTVTRPQPEPPVENKLDRWLSKRLTGLFGGQKRWWVKNWRISALAFFSLSAIGMFLEGTIGGIFAGLLCLGTASVFVPNVAEWISGKAQGKIGPVLARTAIAFVCLFLAGTLSSLGGGEPSQTTASNTQSTTVAGSPSVANLATYQADANSKQSQTNWKYALEAAATATSLAQNAGSVWSWRLVIIHWETAITYAKKIPIGDTNHTIAQQKIKEWQPSLDAAIAAKPENQAWHQNRIKVPSAILLLKEGDSIEKVLETMGTPDSVITNDWMRSDGGDYEDFIVYQWASPSQECSPREVAVNLSDLSVYYTTKREGACKGDTHFSFYPPIGENCWNNDWCKAETVREKARNTPQIPNLPLLAWSKEVLSDRCECSYNVGLHGRACGIFSDWSNPEIIQKPACYFEDN